MTNPTTHKYAPTRRLIGAIALLVAIVTVLVMLPVAEWLQASLVWAEGNRSISWLVFMVVYVVATIMAFPSWILTVAGGYLFGFVGGVAIVTVSALTGATATFLIARSVAYEWVHRRFAGSPRFNAIDRAIEQKALLIVALTRLSLVIPYNVLNYMFGLTAVSLRQYVLGTFAGMLPVMILYVTVGRGARDLDAVFSGEVEVGSAGAVLIIAGLLFAVAVVTIVTRIATRTLRQELESTTDA